MQDNLSESSHSGSDAYGALGLLLAALHAAIAEKSREHCHLMVVQKMSGFHARSEAAA